MAKIVDLQTGICLQWDAERPFIGGLSRQSSYFYLLDKKWYLQLEIENYDAANYQCIVRLKQVADNKCLKTTFRVTTTIINKETKMVISNFTDPVTTVRGTTTLIFNQLMLKKAIQTSDSPQYWRIICLVTCDNPLSLQMNNYTVLLSTTAIKTLSTKADKCIQASQEIPPDMVGLSEDFSNLLEKEIYPDVKLRCGNQIISVHRSVLAARSDVFDAMFRNKMLESETGSVDVTDLEVPVLNSLLKYVYSGKIEDISEDSASSLYEAGDKYAMLSLKRACSDWMIRNMNEENCISYLNLADAHTDLDFKAAVISFIINHPKVLKSTLWLTFSKEHSDLVIEVFQSYADSTIE